MSQPATKDDLRKLGKYLRESIKQGTRDVIRTYLKIRFRAEERNFAGEGQVGDEEYPRYFESDLSTASSRPSGTKQGSHEI